MRRSIRKILSFSLAAAIMAGSLQALPVSASEAVGVDEKEEVMEYVKDGECKYDSFGEVGNHVILATNTTEDPAAYVNRAIFSEESELCIINENGEKLIIDNKNEDGTRKYKYASGWDIQLLYKESGGVVDISNRMVEIGTNNEYTGFTKYESGDKEYFVGKRLNTDTGDIDYDYYYDIIDESNNVVKEGISDSVDRVYSFGEKIVISYFDKVEIYNDIFEMVYSKENVKVGIANDFFAYVLEDGAIYTVDTELNERKVGVIENVDDYRYYSVSGSEGEYIEVSATEWDYGVIRYKVDKMSAVMIETEETEETEKFEWPEYTIEQLVERIGESSVQFDKTKNIEYSYTKELASSKRLIEVGYSSSEPIALILLAEEQKGDLDKALVLPYTEYTIVENWGYVTGYNIDGAKYAATEDKWCKFTGTFSGGYYYINAEEQIVLLYDRKLDVLTEINSGDIEKNVGKGYVIGNVSGETKCLVVEVYNESKSDEKRLIYFEEFGWKEDNVLVLNDGEEIINERISSGMYSFLVHDEFMYFTAEGEMKILYEMEWKKLLEYGNYRYYSSYNTSAYNCYYYIDNGDGTKTYFDTRTEEEIVFKTDLNIVRPYKKTFIISEEQSDGTILYGLAKVKSEFTYGDSTGDGKINVMDAVLMKKHIAGFENLTIELDACDVNVDGRVNVMDAVMVLKYIAGFDVTLGQK